MKGVHDMTTQFILVPASTNNEFINVNLIKRFYLDGEEGEYNVMVEFIDGASMIFMTGLSSSNGDFEGNGFNEFLESSVKEPVDAINSGNIIEYNNSTARWN